MTYTADSLARDIKEIPDGSWNVVSEGGIDKLKCDGKVVLVFPQSASNPEAASIGAIISNLKTMLNKGLIIVPSKSTSSDLTVELWEEITTLEGVIGDIAPNSFEIFKKAVDQLIPRPKELDT